MKSEEIVLEKVEIVCKADSDDCGESEGNKTMLSKEAKSYKRYGCDSHRDRRDHKRAKKQQWLSRGRCNSGALYGKYFKYVKCF